MFKVYTDRTAGNHAPSLPPGAIPLAFPTGIAAFRVAFKALQSDRIVWKIECPDGTIVSRDEIEFIYRTLHWRSIAHSDSTRTMEGLLLMQDGGRLHSQIKDGNTQGT